MNQNEIQTAFCADYFTVLDSSLFRLTVRSKNTGHEWHILEQEYNNKKFYSFSHRHSANTPFHKHGHAPSLEDVARQIKEHDTYQMNGRKKGYCRTEPSP